ncbi:fibropellin-3-like [Mercenaria mercenaria]|uniref:fibropellin-3-like n=1 Tax=Mercenaria mercenaria TaxID=6596 RepID=UPI00234E7A33|nr:fibropellin-3-like [Mercenaria mercenaria]
MDTSDTDVVVFNLLNMCGPPDGPDFGSFVISNVRTLCTFTCNPGYTLTGHLSLQCVQGEWDGNPPVCEDFDECHSSPCLNGGRCVDMLNEYTCTCVPGYAGTHCEQDIDECASSPCQNGATCVDMINEYSCTCSAGYVGLNCEQDYDECQSSPCENGGSCTDMLNAYVCTCAPGYDGTNCNQDVDECTSNPCQNGAVCVDKINEYSCTCSAGYVGLNCEQDCYPTTPWAYNGKKATTITGIPCQRWDSQTPHPHPHTNLNYFPETVLSAAHNYCRNPEAGEYNPWCMTTSPSKEWDYCGIPKC